MTTEVRRTAFLEVGGDDVTRVRDTNGRLIKPRLLTWKQGASTVDVVGCNGHTANKVFAAAHWRDLPDVYRDELLEATR